MLKQILESVSEMLELALAGYENVEVSKTFVICAKNLLDKTISEPLPEVAQSRPRPIPVVDRTKPFGEGISYEVDLDKDKNLLKISIAGGAELPPETMLKVDGAEMEYGKAVGRKFQTVEVL